MSQFTYTDIYQNVVNEIKKRIAFTTGVPYGNQLNRAQTFSASTDSGRTTSGLIETIQVIQDLLMSSIPGTIIGGLNVTATSPISSNVIVESGSGSIGGQEYILRDNTTVSISLTDEGSMYYILLFADRILVSKTILKYHLPIAKIIVPRPGTTSLIQDTKDTSWNAYIINLKEYKLYGNKNGNLEEDSVELLRDNIGQILADNIIGNIKLSENLKIINTQGTLEIDSKSVKIFDTNENILAKFDGNGTFFYNTTGQELAKFSNVEARVGNIRILPHSIQSGNFVSGLLGEGFQIQDTGNVEFNNIIARGRISSSVFEKDTISTIGGNLLVMDGDVLDENMTSLDTSTLTIKGDTTFAIGDILRIKDGVNDEWLEVTNITSAPTYIVNRDKATSYGENLNPAWTKGIAVVNYKGSGKGGIYMTASDINAPHINILTHAGSPWSSTTTRLRIGNLNGFLGYITDLYGIAIGVSDKYLKYDTTDGLQITGNALTADSITADKYNELRNTYVYNSGDSLDSSYPLIVPFKIVSEGTSIQSIKVSFEIKNFRAYSTGVPSGGSATTESGGGSTTESGGGSTSGSGGSQTSSNTSTPSGGGSTSGSTDIGSHLHAITITAGTTGNQVGNYSGGGQLMGCTGGGTIYAGAHSFTIGNAAALSTYEFNFLGGRLYCEGQAGSVTSSSTAHDGLPAHTHTISYTIGSSGNYLTYSANSFFCTGGGSLETSTYVVSHTHTTPDHTHPSHTHTVSDHTHTTPNHAHNTPAHAHNTPAHAHALTFGIYEEVNSPTINIYVDNGSGYGSSIGVYTTTQTDLDITASISGVGWKHIKFTSTTRCRIEAIIECKIDISA